jgi:autotransporter family porin
VEDTTVKNPVGAGDPHDSLGIDFGTNGAKGSGNLSLEMSGNNNVETAQGTAIRVENDGTGASKIGIQGTINVISDASVVDYAPSDGTPVYKNGVEATTYGGGTATITITPNPDENSKVTVNGGGNGILIQSIRDNHGDSGGGDVIGTIGSGITVTDSGNNADTTAGIRASTQDSAQHKGEVGLTTAATVNTTGDKTDGISASTEGGILTVTNSGKVATDGTTSNGIEATSASGAIAVTNGVDGDGNVGSISTQGDSSAGITTVSATGKIAVTNDGSIRTEGITSAGITATTDGGTDATATIINSGAVTTVGKESPGISSQTAAGDNTVSNNASGTIKTTNESSSGIVAVSATGKIAVSNDGSIQTEGTASAGITAKSDGGTDATATIINSGAVTTVGKESPGISSQTAAGDNTVSNNASGTIKTTNESSSGIVVVSDTGKIAVANDGTVTAAGVGSNGIEATTATGPVTITNSGSVISDQGTGILATATDAAGAFELNNQTGASISGGTASGAAGVAIGGNFATARINNDGTIGAANDLAIDSTALAATAPLIINNTGNGVINGYMTLGDGVNTLNNSGTWNLQDRGHGVAVADFGDSGQNSINNSGTINLSPASGAALNPPEPYLPLKPGTVSYATVNNPLNTPAAGGPVQGQILGVATFTNSGVIDLTDGGKNTMAGNVLVISGGHTAGQDGGGVFVSNGGSLLVNTMLNEGGNNWRSDVLVLDSTQLYNNDPNNATKVTINNINGTGLPAGAMTTNGDGIPLVEVLNKTPGASAGGVFVLNSPLQTTAGVPFVRVGGIYDYALVHNGVGADSADGNWYLRSDLCSMNPNLAICKQDTPGSPGMTPGGSETTPGEPRVPLPYYDTDTSVYTAMPSLALQYGHDLLDTLHERVGEEEDIRGRADLNTFAPKTGAWARVFDTHGQRDSNALGIYGKDGPEYDYDFFGLQVGQDLFRKEHDGGSREHVGLYFAYGHADSEVSHFDGSHGRNQFGAYTLGGYWTHFGQSGWYTDAIVQGTYYDTTSKIDYAPDMTTHGNGFAASLEAGKPFRFGHGYFIEPQAQVTYQVIDFADANIYQGATRVSFSDDDSLTGRIGARLGHDWNLTRDRQMTVWLRPNIWHEFRGDTTTEFSSGGDTVPFHSDLGGTWGEINLGVSGQASELSSTRCATSLYANVSYDRSFSGDGYAWTGKVGIRLTW